MDCPVCGGQDGTRFAARYVAARKCSACGHIFAEVPAPDQGLQPHPDPDAEYRAYRDRNRRLVRYWRGRDFVRPEARILDIGAGCGHIAHSLREEIPSLSITCIEGDPPTAGFLRAKGFRVIDSLGDADRAGYDAILLMELIEHVVDPVGLLRQCQPLLRPGGAIFLTTPCGETRFGSRATNAYDTPEHVQFFTERSLRLCCRRAGLRLSLTTINALYPPRGGLSDTATGWARIMRNGLLGRGHLTGFLHA